MFQAVYRCFRLAVVSNLQVTHQYVHSHRRTQYVFNSCGRNIIETRVSQTVAMLQSLTCERFNECMNVCTLHNTSYFKMPLLVLHYFYRLLLLV